MSKKTPSCFQNYGQIDEFRRQLDYNEQADAPISYRNEWDQLNVWHTGNFDKVVYMYTRRIQLKGLFIRRMSARKVKMSIVGDARYSIKRRHYSL